MAHRPMRIRTRELTDPAAINRILLANHIIRIAFYDEDIGFPYIVPINYGYAYDLESGKLVFYVHCAKDGRKLDILRRNNRVAFEIDESWGLRQTESACQWGQNFNSIVGEGYISIIDDEKEVEKRRGLDIIMVKHGRFHDLNYSKESYKRTAVLKLEVERFTVKVYRDRTVPAEESGLMAQPAKK